MKTIKYAIVTTTIFVPVLLEKFAEDVIAHKRNCFFVVVGDKKTPLEAKTYCEDLAKKKNIEVVYMDVPSQVEYLKDFPELMAHLPYNSIQRRNIAILHAYQKGADVIITIDDDNFFLSEDFAGLHTVGYLKKIDVISSDTGWFNVCSFLKEEFDRPFYHRGFAPEKRFIKETTKSVEKEMKIVVNAGFWFGDPDVDALTRLYYPNQSITAVAYERESNFTLAKGTWSPFNSQNTSLAREVIPAYFLSPMVGRYDDIWGAYVLKRITDHLGHAISFGLPIVEQKRNPHNYWKDLAKESDGMILTLRFVNALESISLFGKTYGECYSEITKAFSSALKMNENLTEEHTNYLKNYIEGMNVWIKTFERLNNL